MSFVALKMLIGDRAKYVAIIMGIVFASMLITHQEAIFCGIMERTVSAIIDLGLPDIWVMDPKVQFIDDIKPMQDTQLSRVRGIGGVEWAVPLYKGLLKARLDNGNFQTCNILGLDDSTLIGGPPIMVEGQLADLRRAEAIIVDEVGARDKLAKRLPDGTTTPLRVGDTMELNDHRAVVVGICRVTRTFHSQPVIYTTYSRATTFAPYERKLLSFVLVKAMDGVAPQELCARIEAATGLSARTQEDFKWLTKMYFLRYTGIPINIAIGMVMSFIVGTAIAGQTFYSFTLDNLRHFGALKAMGASNRQLLGMIALQAVVVGLIGYGIGVGAAAGIGRLFRNTEMAFLLVWQALVITGLTVVIICILASFWSVRKVMNLEPAIVFKS
jgi:putative ABC transport system permease protein